MTLRLRSKLLSHVLDLAPSFHDKSMSGALVTRATGDFDNLSESLNMGVLTSIVDIAVLLGCVVGMFILDWRLAMIALVILPLVFAIVQWFSREMKRAMVKARVKIAALNAYTQECFYGHTAIKTLTGEHHAARKYQKLNEEYRDAQMSSVILDAVMFAVLDGGASITLGIALWLIISSHSGSIDDGSLLRMGLSAGVIVAFVQYIQQLFEPLKQLGNKIAMLQGAFSSIDRIFGVLAFSDVIAPGEKVDHLNGQVAFEDVSFSYSQGSGTILSHVSFEVPAGSSLALVGATGSGKSTVIKLLTKLYEGYSGSITIDGKNLRTIDGPSLREQMAIVPQDIVLFDGSVSFNISLDRPGVTQAMVEAASRLVGADRFIDHLPKAYDTEIKEQGKNLSHGQRQLIAFARALVTNPKVVILDEATSSIDPDSERAIQDATTAILHDRTVIVIAHRLSTIEQCDQILVIDQGKILEKGTHRDLLSQEGAYARLSRALTN
jgi:ABC-type multidrug transport system fused ATPase/permease subunit